MIPIYLLLFWLLGYTPILNKILFPNGKRTYTIIHKLAKEEFGNDIDKCTDYYRLKKEIIRLLKRKNAEEFEKNVLATVVHIEHIKQNDFGNYMTLKFSYWAIILATISMIDSDFILKLLKFAGLNEIIIMSIVLVIFTVFLLIMAHTIRNQHNQLEYLNFKMLCINTLKCEREKQNQNTNSSKNRK